MSGRDACRGVMALLLACAGYILVLLCRCCFLGRVVLLALSSVGFRHCQCSGVVVLRGAINPYRHDYLWVFRCKHACSCACTHTPATTTTHTRTCASGRAEEVFVAPHNARPGALVVLSPGWCRSVRQGGRAGACSKLEAYSKFAGHVGVLTRPGVGGSWFALNACTHTHTHNRAHSRSRTDTCV